MLRTCPKCGGLFEGSGIICANCHKPKVYVNVVDLAGKPLTFREKQVVDLVSAGLTNKEVASGLLLSEGTIKVYISRIFLKVGVSNRTALALWWVERKRQNLANLEGANETR